MEDIKDTNEEVDEEENNAEKDEDGQADTEAFSLTDLLGTDSDETGSGPKRVEHRDDEPGSGVVRLTDMVANSSAQQIKTPFPAPPVTDDTFGSISTAPAPIDSPMSSVSFDAAKAPGHKRPALIFAIVAALILVGAVVAYMSIQKKFDAEKQELRELRAQLNKIESNKKVASLDSKVDDITVSKRAVAGATSAGAASAEAASQGETHGKTPADKTAVEKEQEIQSKSKSNKPKRSKGFKSTRRQAKKNRKKSSVTTSSRQPPPQSNQQTEKKESSELDALLDGKTKRGSRNRKSTTGDGMPKTPSKSDVKKAMAPVASRARSCAKYSTGTVQLKVVVGNNGRIKQSKAVGSFAGTTAGKCVEMIVRTAKFSTFKNPSFIFTYPITLR
ncbi:MAG: hypothetical protein GY847_11545 [Proteobacteria bacterium]|nr:hypothetical protein [Pseudomonadota bacterium]